jgi:hypothetical protein
MPRRRLATLGLTIAVGCAGAGSRSPHDASTDTPPDLGSPADVGTTTGDARHDVIVIGGGGARGDAPMGVSEVPPDAPDADTSASADADANANDGTDTSEVLIQSICPAHIPALAVPSGPVTGVFFGPSNNPIVSCQGGMITDGPDAFYTMTLTQATTVDLRVTAPVATVIAIREGPCSDSISEIACGQDPALDFLPTGAAGSTGIPPSPIPLPPGVQTGAAGGTGAAGFFFADASSFIPGSTDASANDVGNGADAGAGADGGTSVDADASSLPESDLRIRLAAGTYTVVVDTFGANPPTPTSYTLTASAITPQSNGSCATPTLLASGTIAADQPLDLAGAPTTVCGTTGSALFYSVGVPPAQRLTARATPKLGDREWMPSLMAFTACSSGTCLAQGHATAGTTQQLDWTNNGMDWQLVDLAVMSDGPVVDATFDLNVVVIDLTATCTRPTAVKDGTALLDQDLSIAPSITTNACTGTTSQAFFYAATLLPMQSVQVVAEPSSPQTGGPFFITVSLITTCEASSQCQGKGNSASFTNNSNTTSTALFEVSTSFQGSTTNFDLHVSMPPPPAHIVVVPTSGLVTSQSGQTATFQVGLTSPPTANVSIAIASDTPTQGTASPTTVTFTPSNWSTPQTVTVTGVDNGASAGPQAYAIVTGAALSTDVRYSGMNPDDVSVTNLDTHPGLLLGGAGDVVTSESGRTASFTVKLNSAPTASVTLPLSSSDATEGTVSPTSLIFTTSNWNVPQTVTVAGVDDMVTDGVQAYTIVTGTLVSTDPSYNGQNPPDVTAHNVDDDYAPVGVKLISGEHGCNNTNRFPIAIDEANKIYIVMSCEMGLWLTTSSDGGVTFSDATMIPNTSNATSSAVELGAGVGGFVYLAYLDGGAASWFLRSTDGGTTWSSPASLTSPTSTLHLAAAKRTVAVLTDAPGGNSTLLSLSVDGGATFPSPTWIPDTNLNVGISSDGAIEWLLETNGNNSLEESTDAAQTFTTVGSVGASLAPVIFGKKSLFGIVGGGSALLIDSLADPTMSAMPLTSLLQTLALAVDDVDTVTVIDIDPTTSHLQATQVSAGATQIVGPKQIGPNAQTAGTVALSRKAVAVAFNAGSVVLFTTSTFP